MTKSMTIDQHVAQVAGEFQRRFGRSAKYAAVAPGRVNLIGEHTDYNDGFVLPMAIERQTVIVADRRSDDLAVVASTHEATPARFKVDATLGKGADHDWANYVKGVVFHSLAAGFNPGGFDAMIDSNVPIGGGLSSSASLEMATATLIQTMSEKSMDPVAKALIGQRAEHTFAGVPCGIMDQFISSLGQQGHAMLLDCSNHQTTMVPLADPNVTVLIANTNKKHQLTGGEYKERRQQCEVAAKALGVKSLREVTTSQLEAAKTKMDELSYRRARHVVGEIERTTKAAQLMMNNNWSGVGELMYQSHNSLRDDFEVSTGELDLMVELAKELHRDGGVYGARMTGGGFGGCTVTLVRTDKLAKVQEHLQTQYQNRTGIEPSIFASRPAQGARVVEL